MLSNLFRVEKHDQLACMHWSFHAGSNEHIENQSFVCMKCTEFKVNNFSVQPFLATIHSRKKSIIKIHATQSLLQLLKILFLGRDFKRRMNEAATLYLILKQTSAVSIREVQGKHSICSRVSPFSAVVPLPRTLLRSFIKSGSEPFYGPQLC